ncbi:MAG: hypothetical protein KDD62_12705, partial [Bdellovibrionales bacterium]|nr:hypothetical protein [Bdellovibrionales bacterium]
MIDRAKLIIVLTLSIFVSTALATESECYTITGGGNGKPVRSYSSSNNTTTYTYTVQDNGGGARCGRIEALLIELIHCNGMPTIEVVDFSPDPKNGDMPPYHAENPGDFTVISDNIFGRNGLRWHGYAGPGTPNANQPEVLVGPNQSRVFSITVRGNNKPQTTAIPFTYLENGERVEPCGHLPGPSCEYMATPTPTPTPTPACPAYK